MKTNDYYLGFSGKENYFNIEQHTGSRHVTLKKIKMMT